MLTVTGWVVALNAARTIVDNIRVSSIAILLHPVISYVTWWNMSYHAHARKAIARVPGTHLCTQIVVLNRLCYGFTIPVVNVPRLKK
jgi:hypothetical protein